MSRVARAAAARGAEDGDGRPAQPRPTPPLASERHGCARARAGPRRVRGPFDLLLTLLLKEELEPADVDMAAIVVAFVEQLAEREELDLEACGGVPRPDRGTARAEGAGALPRRGGRARRARAGGGGRGARTPARRVPADEGGGCLARRAARRRARPLLPARPRAARAPAGAKDRRAGSGATRGDPAPARRTAARGLALAHVAPLPRPSRSFSSAFAPSCAGAAVSTSTPRSVRSRASTRRSRSSRCSSCARRSSSPFPNHRHRLPRARLRPPASSPSPGFRRPHAPSVEQRCPPKKDHGSSAPPDHLESGRPARPHGRGAARRRLRAALGRRARRRGRRRRRADRARARAAGGALPRRTQRDRARARRRRLRLPRRARPRRRASACSSGRSSAGLAGCARDPLDRRLPRPLQSPEIARSVASPPTRPSPVCSSAA